jgi:hypothetical protein
VTIDDCAAFAAIDQPQVLATLVHEHLTADVRPEPRVGDRTAR